MLLSCTKAASAIQAGEIIAYPTEAIYGLGCDPNNHQSLAKLVKLKSRASNKGLILVASNRSQLEPFIDNKNPAIIERASNSWPGPVTWIMPASKLCHPLLTGSRSTIAVRISAHPVVRDLCDACDHALVSTSANVSGEIPLATVEEITNAFATNIAGVVEGELGGLESATSIFDASTGVQLR